MLTRYQSTPLPLPPPVSQLWVQFAYFELRRKDVTAAKKLMGTAIGMCPKEKLFKAYIDLRTKVGRTLPRATYDQADPSPPPLQLYEFDDVRQIYMKYLEFDPSNTAAWIKWATLEAGLGDLDRARHLFDLASTQELDMPEVLWKVRAGSPPLLVLTVAVLADHHFLQHVKAWIDFEFENGERERTRALYEALLSKTGHVKVWIAYALFEVQPIKSYDEDGEEIEAEREEGDPSLARAVLERGYQDLKSKGLKEERVVLLEAWKEFEEAYGDEEEREKVGKMLPRVVKKWRKVEGGEGELEECECRSSLSQRL